MKLHMSAASRYRRGWTLLCSMALLAVAGCWSPPAPANPTSVDATQESDMRAVRSVGSGAWYDSSAKQYRVPKVPVDRDHPLRRSGTIAGPSSTATAGGTRNGWIRWPSGDAIAYTILITLAIALLAVAVTLALASLRNWRAVARNSSQFKEIDIDPSRVTDLPFESQAEMQDPLAHARYLISQGKYDEAILFLYGYMLLALDRAGKVVLHRGKTNRMYLHELAGDRPLRNLLVPAMLAFEDVFFGRHSLEPQRFLKIWGQLDQFHRELSPLIAEQQQSAREALAP